MLILLEIQNAMGTYVPSSKVFVKKIMKETNIY